MELPLFTPLPPLNSVRYACNNVCLCSYKWLWNENEIQSQHITFSESTGILTIPSLSTREEGLFLCHASNTFSNGRTATAVSAALEIRVGRKYS